MTLKDISPGMKARVCGLAAPAGMRRRLQDIGLVQGRDVECVQVSPLGDPAAYRICGAIIALRSEDAQQVLIDETEAAWDYQKVQPERARRRKRPLRAGAGRGSR